MYKTRRTVSASADRASTRPSLNPGREAGIDLRGTTNVRTSPALDIFGDDDSKSRNILAWAGRVKELIGTHERRQNPAMGQLTRATGYADLLAACGVESGDVKTTQTASSAYNTDQTSPATTTDYDASNNLPKPTTSPLIKRLVDINVVNLRA